MVEDLLRNGADFVFSKKNIYCTIYGKNGAWQRLIYWAAHTALMTALWALAAPQARLIVRPEKPKASVSSRHSQQKVAQGR